jgi:hypothetical protein
MGFCLLQSSADVHKVIQAEEIEQVSEITHTAAEPGLAPEVTFAAEVRSDPTMVMEVELVTCQLMECRLGGTSVEHPQYYLPKVLTSPSFSSPLLMPIQLGRYHLGQSWHSQEH